MKIFLWYSIMVRAYEDNLKRKGNIGIFENSPYDFAG
jgi:hypothetical protein